MHLMFNKDSFETMAGSVLVITKGVNPIFFAVSEAKNAVPPIEYEDFSRSLHICPMVKKEGILFFISRINCNFPRKPFFSAFGENGTI